MKHVFTTRKGDQELFSGYYTRFSALSDQELTDAYKAQLRTGLTGVHAQAVYLLALRKAMKERFGESPVTLGDGGVVGLE